MIEEVTKNTARNITNGILLQVCDLQKVEKSEKNRDKEKQQPSTFEKMTKQGENKNQPNAVTMFASEFIGTALLMFLGCMGCFPQVDKPQAFHHLSSLSFGLVVMLIIQGFGHISGAHLNPAVTFAAVILKFVTPMMSLVYVVAQFLGAIVGFGLLKILTPAEYFTDKFCMTLPHEYMSPMQALALETVITTTLIIVVCAVWDKRNEDKQDSTPLRFGLIVACISMVAGPFTGASMNTARTLAPALILGNYTYQWVYWIGPNIGAILGVGIYKFLFALKEEEEHTPDETMNLQDVKLEKS